MPCALLHSSPGAAGSWDVPHRLSKVCSCWWSKVSVNFHSISFFKLSSYRDNLAGLGPAEILGKLKGLNILRGLPSPVGKLRSASHQRRVQSGSVEALQLQGGSLTGLQHLRLLSQLPNTKVRTGSVSCPQTLILMSGKAQGCSSGAVLMSERDEKSDARQRSKHNRPSYMWSSIYLIEWTVTTATDIFLVWRHLSQLLWIYQEVLLDFCVNNCRP